MSGAAIDGMFGAMKLLPTLGKVDPPQQFSPTNADPTILTHSKKPPRLVGSPMMLNQLFESWREWVEVTRRSKDSKKPLGRDSFKGARVI